MHKIDLPETLLKEALKVTKLKTKTAVITTALQDLIRKTRITHLKSYKGKINLKVDLNTLRNR
jgi:Arc/MetJ family transcription regulator